MDDGAAAMFAHLPVGRDRGAAWRTLREAGPVIDLGQFYALTSREGAEFAFRNPAIFSSAPVFQDTMGWPVTPIPIGVDPPDHSRYRRILDPMLAPKQIAAFEPDLRRQVGQIIDGFAAGERVEIVSQLAVPYPSQVFLTLFGLPIEDREQLIRWKDAAINAGGASAGFGAPEDAPSAPDGKPAVDHTAHDELLEYLRAHLRARRAAPPGPDLLGRFLSLDGDEALTDEEILGICFLFVLAGLDTVTAEIGFAFNFLASEPDLRRRLYAEPQLIPRFIEEVVLLEPPAPFIPRVTTREVEVCGRTIPAGAVVAVNVSTVNREPDGGSAGCDGVDLERGGGRHLGFGGGVHRCLGSHLARAELRLVIDEFHSRIPDYEIEPGFEPEVPWPAGGIHLERLPLRLRH